MYQKIFNILIVIFIFASHIGGLKAFLNDIVPSNIIYFLLGLFFIILTYSFFNKKHCACGHDNTYSEALKDR